MSTVQEIQQAIAHLPSEERLGLLHWIHSQEEAGLSPEDSLIFEQAEQGARQLDDGQGISLEAARKLTPTWTTK